MKPSVLLDTSFFIRLLNENDILHSTALGYFKYFLEKDIILKCSTISIAEYCVRGSFDELPWRNVQVVPFNLNHGIRAGEFAKIVFNEKDQLDLKHRNIIPNDSKLFAQADIEESITHFVTSDEECLKIHKILKTQASARFDTINIRIPYNEIFGLLAFD
jgi:predicted nucleic acid-binding protein